MFEADTVQCERATLSLSKEPCQPKSQSEVIALKFDTVYIAALPEVFVSVYGNC